MSAAKRRTNALLDAADDLFAAHPELIRRVDSAAELEGLPEGVVGCLLAIEGGHGGAGFKVLLLELDGGDDEAEGGGREHAPVDEMASTVFAG